MPSHRRRAGRAIPLLVAAFSSAAVLASCGGGGDGETAVPASTASERASDVEVLNEDMEQALTVLDAYTLGISLPGNGHFRPLLRQLRGQAQEHVDGLTKAIRGSGGEVEGEAEEVDFSEAKSEAEFLTLAYELENRALAAYLNDTTRLETEAPRRLAASLAASEAQHLVALRQALGAGLLASFPEGFESGDVPPPGEPEEGEGSQ